MTIAVFLHKDAVTHSTGIVTLKTVAVFILFNSLAVTLSVAEHGLIFRAIGQMTYTFSVGQSVLEVTIDDVTLLGGQLAFTVGQVLLPLSDITVAVGPDEGACPRFLTIKERTGIFITIGISADG